MKNKLTLLAFALMLTVGNAFAHALWIQTAPVGKLGQKQTVKIIYAEPGDKPEKVADWYSDVKTFELWLIGPDQQKTKLTTVAGDDFFTAEFTPEKEGAYTLATGHSAKDLGGATVYQFNAGALVTVGKAATGNVATANANELSVSVDVANAYKVNKPMNLTGLYKAQPLYQLHITVTSPTGWSKTVSTDKNGVADFTPLWPGTYFIEASKSWKEEGKHHDKDYKSFWRCATLVVNVSK